MSAGNDNLFARWSRRKQAVWDSETPPPDPEELVIDAAAPEAAAEPVDQQLEVAESDDAEPAEPLPRLEDLTAESDLSAFLRKGVPKALKSAAMRKMWSLDPAIRDYVGPSDYAWDFNQPGSMAGFGPLDDASESIADFLSTMSSGARAGSTNAIAASEPPEAPQQATAFPPDQDASASPDDPADAVLAGEALEPPHIPANAEPASPDRTAAEPDETPTPAESSRIPAAPRHGRAMPR